MSSSNDNLEVLANLEAILEDLEDICARMPMNFHFDHRIYSNYLGNYALIHFDCRDHRYTLVISERGRARITRMTSAQQVIERLRRMFTPSSGAPTFSILGESTEENPLDKFFFG